MQVPFGPVERLSFPQRAPDQRHVAHDVIEITEAMSVHEAPRLPGDVAGADQLAEDSLQLPTADLERACDMFEPNAPPVRPRQQIGAMAQCIFSANLADCHRRAPAHRFAGDAR